MNKEQLLTIANNEAFHVDVLEKTWRLMDLLDVIQSDETLTGKFALKGGTALNLFYFNVPRLSVDIDLNYIGSPLREVLQEERPFLERSLEGIYKSQGMTLDRAATAHAGGKYQLFYPSLLNERRGTIEVDLNYMFRVPLFPVQRIQSQLVGGRKTQAVQVVSFEEAAAGKLSALMDRNAARDLFDTYHILFETKFDRANLKTAFLAYYVMENRNDDQIPLHKIQVNAQDIKNKLQPVMRKTEVMGTDQKCIEWAKMAATKVRNELEELLQLNTNEQQFLTDHKNGRTLNFGLITEDAALVEKLESHPLIKWVQQKRATASKGRGI